MSMPSPFELGRAVGGNISGAIRGSHESSALDNILKQAMESNDPNYHNDVMRQILTRVSPEKQQAALQILQNKTQQMQQQRQRAALEKEGLNPDLSEALNKEKIKSQQSNVKLNEDLMSKKKTGENALSLVGRLREISKTGHVGPKLGIIGTGRDYGSTFSKEGQALRSEYKQIGKSLVQAASPIIIRNKSEFEHYAKDLENPNRNLEDIEGSLNGLERIIRLNIGDQEAFTKESPSINAQQENQFVKMKDPNGIIRNIPSNQAQAAQAAGGMLIQ